MKKVHLMAAALVLAGFGLSEAQPSHYLFVAAGRDRSDAEPGLAGNTVQGDAYLNIIVADVDVPLRSVTNWRIAGDLPDAHPDYAVGERAGWNYLGDSVHVFNDRIYLGPATSDDTANFITADFVAFTTINSDGTIDDGNWGFSPRFPAPPTNQRISATEIVEVNGSYYYYVMGGNQTEAGQTDRILYAEVNAVDGTIGAWNVSTTPLPTTDWFNGSVTHGGRILVTGGNLRGGPIVDHVVPSATGDITSAFTPVTYTTDFASNRWDGGHVVATAGGNTYHYMIAGTATGVGTTDRVDFAQLDSSGVPGAYTTTNVLPAVRRRLTAAAIDDMIVVPGGTSVSGFGDGVSTVFIGDVATNGTVTWLTGPDIVVGGQIQNRSFHGSAITVAPTSVSDWQLY